MIKKKLKIIFASLISVLLLISGCNDSSNTATQNQENIISNLVSYKDSDYYTNWQEGRFTYINLEGETATVDGEDGVVVEDNQILIRTSGTYIIKGTLNDGQIVVDTEDSGNVRLVLNGTTVHSSTSSPIFVKQADKTIISLEKDTENTLSDATQYVYENDDQNEPSATIYSKDDLTINGSGSLSIKGNYNDAIKSNDDLKITGGTINVTSVDDGIVGKDLLAIKDAIIKVTAGGDGLKSSNNEDNSKGNIALENGEFTIIADGDGIQAEKTVAVANGKYDITTGGGSPDTIETHEDGMGGGMGGNSPENFDKQDIDSLVDQLLEGIEVSDDLKEKLEDAKDMGEIQTILQEYPDVLNQLQEGDNIRLPERNNENDTSPNGTNNTNGQTDHPPDPSLQNRTPSNRPSTQDETSIGNGDNEATEEDSISTKGVKAGTDLTISGGTWKIDSLDDAIHSNQDVTISSGDINISTGDDGIHGDKDVMLNGGTVSIDKSYEGIEGTNITVTDGTYHVISEDDGVNINGGSDEFGMPGQFENMSPPGTNPTTASKENEDTTAIVDDKTPNLETKDGTSDQTEEESTDEGLLLIKGGYLLVDANGDGLDSNASIKMTDGTVIVYGPTNNGNGPLDYNDSFMMEGGVLVASGSSGMAQGISDESSQHAIMMNYADFQEANTAVYVTDKKGKEVIAITPEKQFQSILISTPDLDLNQTYTFHSGGTLSGEHEDGLYQNASYEEGPLTVDFPTSTIMTYLNKDGISEEGSSGMMDGGPFGRNGRTDPFAKEKDNEQTKTTE